MVMPATTTMAGMCFAFPDVCKTPAPSGTVTIPYPNTGQSPTINPGTASMKVLIMMSQTAMVGTETTTSIGDNAGVAGGVVSSTFMQSVKYTKGSSKVLIEGKPCAQLTSVVGQNGGSNANVPPGTHVVPSQPKVIVMP